MMPSRIGTRRARHISRVWRFCARSEVQPKRALRSVTWATHFSEIAGSQKRRNVLSAVLKSLMRSETEMVKPILYSLWGLHMTGRADYYRRKTPVTKAWHLGDSLGTIPRSGGVVRICLWYVGENEVEGECLMVQC